MASNPHFSFDLRDRVALVVGASRGIGAAVARTLAAQGASVALAARDEAALDVVCREIEETGARAVAVPMDITDNAAVEAMVDRTVSVLGRLDVACNNAAGVGHRPMPLVDVDIDDFDSAYGVNLRGVFLGMKHEIPAMVASGGGAIVNTSSTAGLKAVGGLAAYVSTKHAVEGLTRVAALDHAADGVRVNSVAPGPTLTEQLARAGQDGIDRAAAAMPLGRVATPEEVAGAICWLCSDQAAFVTGSTLVIDGGQLAGAPPFNRDRGPQ